MLRRRMLVSVHTTLIVTTVLVLALAVPAGAQTADSARAEAFGAEIQGAVEFGPEPSPVSAEVPPGESDSDEFLEVPAEPAVFSATLAGEVEASQEAAIAAKLQQVIDDAAGEELPQAWNARGHAITEDLAALFAEGGGGGGDNPLGELGGGEDPGGGEDLGGGEDVGGELEEPETAEPQQQQEPLLTAEVVESEAVAGCQDGSPVFATGSRVEQVTFGGEDVDLSPVTELVVQGEPNEDVLANIPGGEVLAELGLEITAWETNWDGATGTTDGSDQVWVNALHVSVAEDSDLGQAVGAQDVVVSHSEASVACDGVGPQEIIQLGKDASQDTVAPGDSFTYTLSVANTDASCTLENIEVVDAISGPAGSEITATSPEADDIDDLTVTWTSLDPLAPGEETTLTVDVAVPSSAADGEVYEEDVSATGECDGQPIEGELTFQGPRVAAPGAEPLPRTGGGTLPLGGLLLGGGALAAVLRRLSA